MKQRIKFSLSILNTLAVAGNTIRDSKTNDIILFSKATNYHIQQLDKTIKLKV